MLLIIFIIYFYQEIENAKKVISDAMTQKSRISEVDDIPGKITWVFGIDSNK